MQRRALCAGAVDGDGEGGARGRCASTDAPPHVARRLSGLARSASGARVRRRARRRRRGACEPRAARFARQHACRDARRGAAEARASWRRSRRAGRRSGFASGSAPTPKARRSMPSRLSQGSDRNPGRGLAACRFVGRRQARRAGHRSLRRRRRQDAGARGGDGKPRPDLRDRHRQAAARADPRAHRALRRAQYPGAHA